MKIKIAPYIKHSPDICFKIESWETPISDAIESFIFHLLAFIGCFGGWWLTMYLFFKIFKPV